MDSLQRDLNPPDYIGPKAERPETIVDNHNVFLVDNEGNFIGRGSWIVETSPTVISQRAGTRRI